MKNKEPFFKNGLVIFSLLWLTVFLSALWYVGPKARFGLWRMLLAVLSSHEAWIDFAVLTAFALLFCFFVLLMLWLFPVKVKCCPTCGQILPEGHSLCKNQENPPSPVSAPTPHSP